MHRVLRGCIQLKSAPDANMMVDMTPVDYVSRASFIYRSKRIFGKSLHVLNSHPIHWRELVTWLRSFGYPIRQISNQEWQSGLMEQWQAELLNVNGFSSENALHSLVLLFSESVSEPSNSQCDSSTARIRLMDCRYLYHLSTSR